MLHRRDATAQRYFVLNPSERHPIEPNLLVGRRKPQSVPAVRAGAAPSSRNNIALRDHLLDTEPHVRKSAAIRAVKSLEVLRTTHLLTQTMHYAARSHQCIDSVFTSLAPDLLKPTKIKFLTSSRLCVVAVRHGSFSYRHCRPRRRERRAG